MKFEDYRAAVRKGTIENLKAEKKADIEKFLDSDEIEDFIRERYEADLKDFKNGKFEKSVFENGCVNSVAYCLFMMY